MRSEEMMSTNNEQRFRELIQQINPPNDLDRLVDLVVGLAENQEKMAAQMLKMSEHILMLQKAIIRK